MSKRKQENSTTESVAMENQVEQTDQILDEEVSVPETQTLRKVEVLSNLANACKNKDVVKAIRSLPDGEIILKIFVQAMQLKINQIMTGQQEQEIIDGLDVIRNNIESVDMMARKLQEFFVHLHQSPLVEVLRTLSNNLLSRSKPEPQQNPYQQSMTQSAPQAPQQPNTQVSPYYESQIEQTPKFTQQRRAQNQNPNSNEGAPTAPPRFSPVNGW
ncbi:MAG: hypothetical protein QXL01_00790 [Thermoplasmatales archaeon]